MTGNIELLLPGLFDLPPGEVGPVLDARLGSLNRILRFASPRPNQAYGIDAMLQDALALEAAPGLPLAQAQAAAAGRDGARLLLFQAVHLRPDLQNATLVPIQKNEKNQNDITIVINDLKEIFKADCNIDAVTGDLFLMELRNFDAPLHYPHILSVLGKAASPYIEKSRAQLGWYKLLNEMQMFLHQHEINLERLRRGQLPLNSLWFWGAGEPPDHEKSGPAFYCDDVLLSGFSRGLGLETASLVEISKLGPSTDALVVDLRLLELLKSGTADELEPLLLDLENGLLGPLMRLLERDRRRLLLRAGFEFDFELGPLAPLRFWRRPRGLEYWARRESTP